MHLLLLECFFLKLVEDDKNVTGPHITFTASLKMGELSMFPYIIYFKMLSCNLLHDTALLTKLYFFLNDLHRP